MKCPKCNTEMIIDEYRGWIWTCFHCDHIDREAKDEEIENLEQNKKQ